MKDQLAINEEFLMERLGPTPTVAQVVMFVGESVKTTWRRLVNGELKKVDGSGVAKITLARCSNSSTEV